MSATVTDLNAAGLGQTWVRLAWGRHPTAGSYNASRSADRGATWTPLADVSEPWLLDTGRTAGTSYLYRVRPAGGDWSVLAVTTPAAAVNPLSATWTGTPAYAADATGWGQAATPNGSNSRVNLPAAPFQFAPTAQWTVNVRLKWTGGATGNVLAGAAAADGSWVWCLKQGAAGNVVLSGAGFSDLPTPVGTPLNTDQWHLFTLVVSTAGGAISLYLNGAGVDFRSRTTSGLPAVTAAGVGGTSVTGFGGVAVAVGELRVLDTGTAGPSDPAPPTPYPVGAGTVGLWHFDGDLASAIGGGGGGIDLAVPATYYFSASGTDGNAGTSPAGPKQTLAAASALSLNPGDWLLLKSGETFSGTLTVATTTAAGAAGAAVRVGRYGGSQRPVVSCGDGDGVAVLNRGRVHVHDLAVVGSGVSPEGETTSTGTGVRFYSDATSGPKWRDVAAVNCHVSGCKSGIRGHTPYGGQAVVGYDGVWVERNQVTGCQMFGIDLAGGSEVVGQINGAQVNIPVGQDTFLRPVFRGNYVHDNTGWPEAEDIGCNPLCMSNSTDGLVEGNLVLRNGYQAFTGAAGQPRFGGGFGAIIFFESKGCLARFNEAGHHDTEYTADGLGFDTDAGCQDCVFEFNYSHDNAGAGFLNCTLGSRPNSGNVCRFNLSVNDGLKNSAPALYGHSGADWLCYHNTVIQGPGGDGQNTRIARAAAGHVLANNLFVRRGPSPALLVVAEDDGDFRGNLYWSETGHYYLGYGGYSSVPAWRAATGQETLDGAAVGAEADPLLADPTVLAGTGTPFAPLPRDPSFDPPPGSPAGNCGVDLRRLGVRVVASGPGTDLRLAPLPAAPFAGAVAPHLADPADPADLTAGEVAQAVRAELAVELARVLAALPASGTLAVKPAVTLAAADVTGRLPANATAIGGRAVTVTGTGGDIRAAIANA